jgi:hypothetical protein
MERNSVIHALLWTQKYLFRVHRCLTNVDAHVNPSCYWLRTENLSNKFDHTATGKQTLRDSHGSEGGGI